MTVITIVIIYVITVVSQMSRFIESRYEPIMLPSLVAPNRSVLGCRPEFADWVSQLPLHLVLVYNLPYWSNAPFFIFDIRALWRSGLSARAPECQKLKMVR